MRHERDNTEGEHAPKVPVLIYDRDCAFCRFWMLRWQARTGTRVRYLAFQDDEVAKLFPSLSPDTLRQAVHFIETDGQIYRAAHAVLRLRIYGGKTALFWFYEHVPGVRLLSETVYRLIARWRAHLYRLSVLLFGKEQTPDNRSSE